MFLTEAPSGISGMLSMARIAPLLGPALNMAGGMWGGIPNPLKGIWHTVVKILSLAIILQLE